MAFPPSVSAEQGAALVSHDPADYMASCTPVQVSDVSRRNQLGHRHCTTGQNEKEKENERHQ